MASAKRLNPTQPANGFDDAKTSSYIELSLCVGHNVLIQAQYCAENSRCYQPLNATLLASIEETGTGLWEIPSVDFLLTREPAIPVISPSTKAKNQADLYLGTTPSNGPKKKDNQATMTTPSHLIPKNAD